MQRRVGILGAGNMGSALAKVLAENGHDVAVWDFFPEVIEEINAAHSNSRYLPGILMPPTIRGVLTAAEAARGANLIVVALPSLHARRTVQQAADATARGTVIICATKGIDPEFECPAAEALEMACPSDDIVLLAGPAIANEFARRQTTVCLFASRKFSASETAAGIFQNAYFHGSQSTDFAGAALGGILKNVYALLLGYLEGTKAGGRNLEAAVFSAAVAEMRSIGTVMGGRKETFHGLAGLGDLAATGFSTESHNRKCGLLLGSGLSLADVEREMKLLPEGVRATEMIVRWARAKTTSVPLAEFVFDALANRHPPVTRLFPALIDPSGHEPGRA